MSSPDDAPLSSVDVGPEGGKQAKATGINPRSPPGSELGLNMGVPLSGEGEGRFQGTQGLELEKEVMAVGEIVGLGRERPLRSLVSNLTAICSDDGDPQVTEAETAERCEATIVNKLSTEAQSPYRNLPSESIHSEVSKPTIGFQTGTRGAGAQSHVDMQPGSIPPIKIGEPERGQIWRVCIRSSMGRWNAPRGQQLCLTEGLLMPPPDGEKIDESGKIQTMRMSICAKEGEQAGSSSTEIPRDTTRPLNFSHQSVFSKPTFSMRSPPQGTPMGMERQSVADQETIIKIPNVVWGRGQGKPSYSGASAACSLPMTTPRIVIQEKKFPGNPSKVILQRSLPSWGQGTSAVPSEVATFPPISGTRMTGTTQRYYMMPPQNKQPKNMYTSGKKFVVRELSECELVAREDNESNKDPTPKGEMQATRPKLPGQSMRLAEGIGGSFSARVQRAPGNSLAMVMSQGDFSTRGPAPLGNQEKSEYPPIPELLHLPPGRMDCPRCAVLQTEVERLKKRLAILESLADRIQDL